MNLVMYGTSPMRLLVGDETFKVCQENRTAIVDGGIPDTLRFINLMADPANTIVEWEDTPEGIAEAKEKLKAQINANKEAAAHADIVVGGVTYQSDEKSMFKVLATYTRAAKEGAGFTQNWVDATNNVVVLSQADIFALGNAMMDREATAIFDALTKKSEVDALTTRAEVEAYVV